MQVINVRHTGTGTVTVYGDHTGYSVQLIRQDGTQTNRTARNENEALVIQSELYLAEPAQVDMYADNMYDE
jgi:hypothetical protein